MEKLIIPLNVQRFANSNGCSVTVSETTNTATNTSTFVVSATVTTNSTTYNQTSSGAYVQGSYSGGASGTLSKQSFKIAKSSSVTKTWTIENVQHNADGTLGEITFSVTWYVTSSSSSHGTTTKSIQPATIPRYTSTTNLQLVSKTETSLTFFWSTANACSQIRYGTSTSSYTTANVNGSNGQFTISGLNPNSPYTLCFMPKRSDSGLWGNGSDNAWAYYQQQYTYDYPKVNSIYDITLKPSTSDPNTDLWVNFDNPLGKTFRYEIISDVDNSVIYSENNFSGSSIGIPLTTEILENFYETIPSAQSGTYHVNVYYQSITKTSGSKKYTIDADTCKPTMSVVGYEDIRAQTLALTGDDQVLIKNYSTIQVTIPANNKATPNMYASIVGYKIKNGDYVSPNIIPEVEGEDVILTCTATNGLIEIYTIDSREQSGVYQIANVPLIDYRPIERGQYPIAQRCDAQGVPNGIGEYVKITLDGTFWNDDFGDVNNSITSISYNYANTQTPSQTTPGETSITATITNNTYEIDQLILGDTEEGFDVANSYIINVTVNDELSSATFTMTLGSGTPHIAYSPNGVSIMGKYNEEVGGLFQVGGQAFTGGDTLPINSIFDYDGSTVPDGYEEVVDYSTNEINTHQEWIDGKDIYRKVVNFGALPNATTKQVAHGITNLNFVISYKILAKNPTYNYYLSVPATNPVGLAYTVAAYIDNTNVIVQSGDNKSGYSICYVIIEYTKN